MAGYVWNGTPEPPKPPRPRTPRKQADVGTYCGTRTGYAIHKRGKEKACQPCKEAENAYSREYRRKIHNGLLTPPTPFNPDACGTMTGYRRHQRHRVTICQPCRDAHNICKAKYRANKKAA